MPKEFWVGDDGKSAEDLTGKRSKTEKEQAQRAGISGKSGVAQALQKLGSGEMSLDDFMNVAGKSGISQDQLRQIGLTDAISGRNAAGEALRSDPMGANLYGEEGLANQLSSEGRRLAGEGGQLQAEDFDAYGQASDNIARLAGQRESDIANSLASRGMGQSGSGAAGAAFSGAAGNKFEQLQQAQFQIADQRKQRQIQQLQENRRMQAQLGSQYEQGLGNQFNRAVNARQMGQDQRTTQQQADMTNRNSQQAQLNEAFAQQQATKRKGFFQNVGDAVTGGISEGLGFMAGGGADDVTGALLGSDERNKENISFSGEEVAELFRAMKPATFEYSDDSVEGAGPGPRAGVMAQDIEASGELGENMVAETDQGKMLDKDSILSALMAEVASQRKELDSLKGRG